MKRSQWVCGLIAAGCMIEAQTLVDLRTQSKNVDFSAASTTKSFKSGATLPATCSPGETFFLTSAAAGQNFYGCSSANTWSKQSDCPACVESSGPRMQDSLTAYNAAGQIIASGCQFTGGGLSCVAGTTASGIEFPELTINGSSLTAIYAADSQAANGCVIWPQGNPAAGQAAMATGTTQTPAGTALSCAVMAWTTPSGGGGGGATVIDKFWFPFGQIASTGTMSTVVASRVYLWKFVPTVSASVRFIDLDVNTNTTGVYTRLGLYDSAGSLIGQCSVAIEMTTGTKTCDLSSTHSLSANAAYYLAFSQEPTAGAINAYSMGSASVNVLNSNNDLGIAFCANTAQNSGTSFALPSTCGTISTSGLEPIFIKLRN